MPAYNNENSGTPPIRERMRPGRRTPATGSRQAAFATGAETGAVSTPTEVLDGVEAVGPTTTPDRGLSPRQRVVWTVPTPSGMAEMRSTGRPWSGPDEFGLYPVDQNDLGDARPPAGAPPSSEAASSRRPGSSPATESPPLGLRMAFTTSDEEDEASVEERTNLAAYSYPTNNALLSACPLFQDDDTSRRTSPTAMATAKGAALAKTLGQHSYRVAEEEEEIRAGPGDCTYENGRTATNENSLGSTRASTNDGTNDSRAVSTSDHGHSPKNAAATNFAEGNPPTRDREYYGRVPALRSQDQSSDDALVAARMNKQPNFDRGSREIVDVGEFWVSNVCVISRSVHQHF